MSRQIAFGARGPSRAALEERIRELEARTATLSEAVRLLAYALGGNPLTEPGEVAVAQAARKAQGLLSTSR
ncbi:hypothetical protein [Actinomadura sp. HBU206391]|uniref:hypothetical protein n=1 Tax=Actinomadura sp. HBU206391 TaxID=2731692 RepID=UPI0016504AEC|nr:hypothetical protein [Actinomadura sp. HBU206391]MBC6463608.1 hypothetical protein [Actinomadura sp. HBU206391]